MHLIANDVLVKRWANLVYCCGENYNDSVRKPKIKRLSVYISGNEAVISIAKKKLHTVNN